MTKDAMKEKPYFIHIRNHTYRQEFGDWFPDGYAPTGGATIAVVYNPDLEVHIYAVALCNPKDNYNKKIGRKIAEGRLRTHPFVLEFCETMSQAEEELRMLYPDALCVSERSAAWYKTR